MNRNVMEHLGHFNSIVLSLACILMKQHVVCGGKYLLETPQNPWKMSLDASALKKTCAFGVSSKAAYYSLSARYLKAFRQPWLETAQNHFLGDGFATITIVVSSLAESDICKTYAHAIDLLCWTMFRLCYVHYYLCINYATYHIT